MSQIICIILLFIINKSIDAASIINRPRNAVDDCYSPIYCQGKLLKTIQLAEVFPDSKTFVDLSQVDDTSVTLAKFDEMMKVSNDNPNKSVVADFVKKNFVKGKEILPWTPPDWQSNPEILNRIKDPNLRKWLSELNFMWKILARQMSPDIIAHPERHSLLPLENGFIVPGGRFQETYYWDTYWVIEGLLLSGMTKTVKGILLNFLTMINNFGFIPNGGRVYYLMRSQPPLFIPMVARYIEATSDIKFLSENILLLEEEFLYFQERKTTYVVKNGKTYKMARYVVNSDGPRPESYREDYKLGETFKTNEERRNFYENIKAGAESGWDFSSRWFIPNGPNNIGNLSDISTSDIIPVDLNAFLQRNARILSAFNSVLGNEFKARKYMKIAREYQRGIDQVLWNEELGIWLDYDVKNQKQRERFYPTNLTPLYTKSFNYKLKSKYAKSAVNYLKLHGIMEFPGGTPTSLINETNQQWDGSNAWPPLQSIIVQGLRNTDAEPAISAAKLLATRWIRANYIGFEQYGAMFEKYDAALPGQYGGGGEYIVQTGFGWTNGVVFEFLNMYPNTTAYDGINFKSNQSLIDK